MYFYTNVEFKVIKVIILLDILVSEAGKLNTSKLLTYDNIITITK